MVKAKRSTPAPTKQSHPKKERSQAKVSAAVKLMAALKPIDKIDDQSRAHLSHNLDLLELFARTAVPAPDAHGTIPMFLKEIEAVRTLMNGAVYDNGLTHLYQGLLVALDHVCTEDLEDD
jgi:hypothetical protein